MPTNSKHQEMTLHNDATHYGIQHRHFAHHIWQTNAVRGKFVPLRKSKGMDCEAGQGEGCEIEGVLS